MDTPAPANTTSEPSCCASRSAIGKSTFLMRMPQLYGRLVNTRLILVCVEPSSSTEEHVNRRPTLPAPSSASDAGGTIRLVYRRSLLH